MATYDVTLTLQPNMPTYPGEPGPQIQPLHRIAEGAPANVSLLSLGSHTGTHVDAPSHFLEGAPSVDRLPLEALYGPAWVLPMAAEQAITAQHLEAMLPAGARRVLFKTRNSQLWDSPTFRDDFVYLEESAARWLVARGILLVGIDYLSVERFDSTDFATHLTLLRAGVVILEGLDLRAVPGGQYTIACLPLKLQGVDGAPARVILVG